MRHLKRGRKLNRTPTHKKAMLRNLVTSLFLHGRVKTTPAKAKEARPFAEKLITLARKGSLHARRRAISLLHDKSIVKSLFEELGPRYANRPGGYTRILHTSQTRIGDSAPIAIFELVEAEMESAPSTTRAAVAEEGAAAETKEAPAPASAEAAEGEATAEEEKASSGDAAASEAGSAEEASAPAEESGEAAAEGEEHADAGEAAEEDKPAAEGEEKKEE